MEFDFTWLLWALPLAFGMGWLASRFDLQQWRIESRQAPQAYFKGLNHLLNEDQDQAIGAFIEAVQHDPDTAELHFALGHLFRGRGDYDRAVRVHEHLLSRADLQAHDRLRAQRALAQDFLKAGLLDRAEQALSRLEGSVFETEARWSRLAIYERTREWDKAAEMARGLDTPEHPMALRLAHYACEGAEGLRRSQRMTEALTLLEAVVQQHPGCARAWIALADLRHALSHTSGAWEALRQLNRHAPSHTPLVAHNLAVWGRLLERSTEARQLLLDWQAAHEPSLDVTQALATLAADSTQARRLYIEHMRREPSLVAAGLWLGGQTLGSAEEDTLMRQALERAAAPLKRYRCLACGFEARQYFWHCPGCQRWDSYPPRRVEEI
jgi:lipopolysaccharide assembly protein B